MLAAEVVQRCMLYVDGNINTRYHSTINNQLHPPNFVSSRVFFPTSLLPPPYQVRISDSPTRSGWEISSIACPISPPITNTSLLLCYFACTSFVLPVLPPRKLIFRTRTSISCAGALEALCSCVYSISPCWAYGSLNVSSMIIKDRHLKGPTTQIGN